MAKRPFKVTDRFRQIRKGIVAKSLKDLMKKSVDKLGYDERRDVYLVLEEVRHTLDSGPVVLLLYCLTNDLKRLYRGFIFYLNNLHQAINFGFSG